jgi:phage gpG-like protein
MPYTVKLNGAEAVVQKLRNLGGKGLMTSDVLRGVGELAVRSVKRGIREQREPDGTPYKPVNRFGQGGKRLQDTSQLLNSITYEISGDRVRIGTNVKYAAMQHFGGTQRPTHAKALAIPMTRQVARAVAAAGNFRAAFPDAFVFRSISQGAFLVRRKPDVAMRTKGRGLEFLATLVKSVRIESTHFLGLSAEGDAAILHYLERTILRITGEG